MALATNPTTLLMSYIVHRTTWCLWHLTQHRVFMRQTLATPQTSLNSGRHSPVARARSSNAKAKQSKHHPGGGGNRQSGQGGCNTGQLLHVELAWRNGRDRHGAGFIKSGATGIATDSWQHSLANCCSAASDHPDPPWVCHRRKRGRH